MFNFFKKKSPLDRLQVKYEQLTKEAHRLSSIDRTASDEKYADADRIAQEMERLSTGEDS